MPRSRGPVARRWRLPGGAPETPISWHRSASASRARHARNTVRPASCGNTINTETARRTAGGRCDSDVHPVGGNRATSSLGVVGMLIAASGAAAGGSAALGSDTPSWSPDGSMIAYAGFREGRAGDIYAMPAYGGREIRLTATRHHDDFPRWSPDGCRIAFVRTVNLVRQLIVMNVDGTGQRQLTHGRTRASRRAGHPTAERSSSREAATTRTPVVPSTPTAMTRRVPTRRQAMPPGHLRARGRGRRRDAPHLRPGDRLVAGLLVARRPADRVHEQSGRGRCAPALRDAIGRQRQRKLTDHPVSYHSEKRPAWSADGLTIAFVDNRHPPGRQCGDLPGRCGRKEHTPPDVLHR